MSRIWMINQWRWGIKADPAKYSVADWMEIALFSDLKHIKYITKLKISPCFSEIFLTGLVLHIYCIFSSKFYRRILKRWQTKTWCWIFYRHFKYKHYVNCMWWKFLLKKIHPSQKTPLAPSHNHCHILTMTDGMCIWVITLETSDNSRILPSSTVVTSCLPTPNPCLSLLIHTHIYIYIYTNPSAQVGHKRRLILSRV